jgi:protein-disulfide isomerase
MRSTNYRRVHEDFDEGALEYVAMTTKAFHLVEPVGPTDHVRGPDRAPVTLVEYGDFECPHCKNASGAVKILQSRFDGQVRLVFRNFPLEEIHAHALQAALAAECAGAQGRFWEMHDLLFENQLRLGMKQLTTYARSLELDMPRFTTDMNGEVFLERVREQQQSGDASGVRATPGFFLNGHIQDVSYGLQSLFDAVEAELRAQRIPGQAPADREVRPGPT